MLRSRAPERRLEARNWFAQAFLALSASTFVALSAGAARAGDESNAAQACAKAEAFSRPAPTSAGPAPNSCDALALYDGVGGKPDHRAARACALNVEKDETGLNAAAVLSMIYANGDGVTRDDDLAVAYACDAGGAPAEISGRIAHLLERKRQGAAVAERFDFCDDITSGLMQGFCASRESAKAGAARAKDLADLTAKLPARAKAAYAALAKAFETFKDAVGENEVDLSGTARGAMMIEAEDEEAEAFRETLRLVLAGRSAPAGKRLAEAADAALNAAYRKAMAERDESRWGTVTKDGIRTAQRAWLPYRDRFVDFAQAAGSKTAADALSARLTRRRAESLEAFAQE